MGSRFVLPLSIAAALVAGGLVYWFSAGHARPASTTESHASEAKAPRSADDAALNAPTASPEPTHAAERSAVESLAPAASAASRAPSSGRDQGNVAGRVVDRLGMPVRDASVKLGERFDFFRDDAAARTAEATTDVDGRFSIAWDRAGDCRLAVRAHGFAPQDRAITLAEGAALDVGAIVLSQGAILSGRVVDVTGRPVPGAEVLSVVDSDMGGLVFVGGRRELVATADRDGSFRIDELACGPWKVLVRSEDHPERAFSGDAPEPGVETSGLVFELEAGTMVTGWVTGLPSGEATDLSVRAVRAVEGDEDRPAARTATLDAEGRFSLHGLAVDASYDLRLVARERRGEFFGVGRTRSDTRRARAGDNGVVLVYLPGAAVTFQVLDQTTQEPVETFDVEYGIRFTETLRDENERPLRVHPEGRVRLDDLRPAGDGELVTIAISAAGYEDLRQEVELSKGQELDLGQLYLRRVPRVLVHVTDARTGDPIPGARVTLDKDQGAGGQMFMTRRVEVGEAGVASSVSFGERTATTDDKGDAALTSFEGETCVIAVEAEGFARAQASGLALPRGEDFKHAFALTGGGDVLVRVFDAEGNPLPGAKVRHRAPGPSVMMLGGGGKPTDGEGKVRFDGLEPGVHGFQLDESKSGGGFVLEGGDIAIGGPAGATDESWTEVEVREDSVAEVELRASPRAELAGTIREGGNPLAGARVALSEKKAGGRPFGIMGFGGGEQARTDGHGEYHFGDLKAGRYTVTVEHSSRAMPSEYEFEVEEGENDFDIDLPVSILEGRVTDPDGKPLAGIAVQAERLRPDEPRGQFISIAMTNDADETVTFSDGSSPAGARTDADGRYTLRGVASDVELVVKGSGDSVQEGSSEPVTVGPDQTRSRVDFSLAPAGAVQVEALLADGAGAQMCLVEANYLGEGGIEPKVGFIQSRSTKITGLRPGPWRLNVRRMGLGDEDRDSGKEQDVDIVAGETASATVYVE